MNQVEWTLLAIGVGISSSGLVIWRLQNYRKTADYQTKQGLIHLFLKFEETVITRIHHRLSNWFRTDHQQQINPYHMLEILLIGLWAFWVGREYLNFDPGIIPSGREFNSAIQTHHLWTRFAECGWCALWNGTARGGNPAFADSYGSMLHPLVAICTAIWGVLNGAKLTLVLSFWTAGIAQWWIARELKLGWLPRLWSSAMAVVGGHLAGRMELGLYGIVLSTSMTSLLFGGILAVMNRPGLRSSASLGLVGASAILAGQGYIQLGIMGTLPAFSFLLINHRWRWKPIWKYYLLALGITILVSAVFLIPFIHFSPNFAKYLDPNFKVAQPLKYIPLNYLIDTFEYYQSNALEKYPFPSLYTLFIGWIPVLLAAYGLTDKKNLSHSVKWYMIGSMVMILLLASGTALRPLAKIWDAVAGFRHPSLIAGLTIPLVLGFSGVGLDQLLHIDWPKLNLSFSENSDLETWSLPTQWILILPLLFSLYKGYQFTEIWIHTQEINPEVYQVAAALETDSMQWVQTPFGEHIYIEPAIKRGIKLTPGIIPWTWKDRELPLARLEASHSGQPEGTSGSIKSINNITIYQRPEVEYAVIINDSQETPCSATGSGGRITVICYAEHPGKLVLKEYTWSGWKAWRDGNRVDLLGKQWLTVEAPAGKHTYTFRYQPWDVPLGMMLSGLGIALSLGIWFSPPSINKEDQELEKKA